MHLLRKNMKSHSSKQKKLYVQIFLKLSQGTDEILFLFTCYDVVIIFSSYNLDAV